MYRIHLPIEGGGVNGKVASKTKVASGQDRTLLAVRAGFDLLRLRNMPSRMLHMRANIVAQDIPTDLQDPRTKNANRVRPQTPVAKNAPIGRQLRATTKSDRAADGDKYRGVQAGVRPLERPRLVGNRKATPPDIRITYPAILPRMFMQQG